MASGEPLFLISRAERQVRRCASDRQRSDCARCEDGCRCGREVPQRDRRSLDHLHDESERLGVSHSLPDVHVFQEGKSDL